MPFKTILWPTDASEPSLRALRSAVELAETYGAKLYALQAITPVPMISQTDYASTSPTTFDVPFYEQQLLEAVKKSLQETVAEHVPGKISVEPVVQLGEADKVIVDFVRREKVDMIVMATHGRSGFAHFLLGSVAEKVIRSSPVPVLTVPAAPEESTKDAGKNRE